MREGLGLCMCRAREDSGLAENVNVSDTMIKLGHGECDFVSYSTTRPTLRRRQKTLTGGCYC